MDNSMARHMAIKTTLSTWMVNYQTALAVSEQIPSADDFALLSMMEIGIRAESLENAEMAVSMLLVAVDRMEGENGDLLREKLNETEAFFIILMKGPTDDTD